MNTIIPFQFETHAVRVQVDDLGQPWFNANDICSALELTNPHKAVGDHVDSDDLTKREVIDSLGRTQHANHVNESGLYALILGSKKQAAKRFKRWVTSEVLPTIHKTGRYSGGAPSVALPSVTQDRVSAILLIGEWLAKVPGVQPGIAAAMTLNCIQDNTSIIPAAMRKALPPANEPICSLNATQLGTHLGLSAKATNQLLASTGFQWRNERNEWELTKAGAAWAQALPYARNHHSGYQILWNPAVAAELKKAA